MSAPAPITPELLDLAEVAHLLGIGQTLAKTMNADGRLGPMPVRLGRAVRWRRRELIDWIDAGLPRREAWIERERTAGRTTAHPKLAKAS